MAKKKQQEQEQEDPYKVMAVKLWRMIVETDDADDEDEDNVSVSEYASSQVLARLVTLMDGDRDNRLLQELKRIDITVNPHLYDLSNVKRKQEKK